MSVLRDDAPPAPVAGARPGLSLVVPALNEAPGIRAALAPWQPLRAQGHEVIVVDGGSDDGTPERARPLATRVIRAGRGRARQMNAGAALARGEVLLFLHADTLLAPRAALEALARVRERGEGWGRFDVRLTGSHPLFRIIERASSLRSRVSGIATGDQAMFVSRSLFERVGGFPDIPLMEDVALSRTLRAVARPICLRGPARTSSRRWERHGVLRTMALMWGLRAAHALGVPPERLARLYPHG